MKLNWVKSAGATFTATKSVCLLEDASYRPQIQANASSSRLDLVLSEIFQES